MREIASMKGFRSLALLILCLLPWLSAQGALYQPGDNEMKGMAKQLFPEATEIKAPAAGMPAWQVYQVTEVIGYVYLSGDYIQLPGFSGAPYQLVVGIDHQGLYRGAFVVEQHEPIFLHGLGTGPMLDFVAQYPGLDIRKTIKMTSATVRSKQAGANQYVDGITKATVSAIVLNETIMLSAQQVAQKIGIIPRLRPPATVKADVYEKLSWQQLLDQGLVQRQRLSLEQLEQAFSDTSADSMGDEPVDDNGQVADLYFAYLNVPTIGRYLLGDAGYQRLMKEELASGEHAIAVISTGPYSVLGEEFVPGTPPDRLALYQNEQQIGLRDIDFLRDPDRYMALEELLTDEVPAFEEYQVFRIKAAATFDPASPWQLALMFTRSPGYLRPDVVEAFPADYHLPQRFFDIPDLESLQPEPMWMQIWRDRQERVIGLLLGLAVLTGIIVFHRQVTANASLFKAVRWGFLAYTLVFIGYITQGQLSITNVFTIVQVLMGKADSSIVLLDPIIFLLWCYVLVTLVIWGRGYFCGWLCPFGILQEISAWLGEKVLKLKQKRIPFGLHQKLWLLKYLIFIGLVVTCAVSTGVAEQAAEVEPFKTAITMGFVREWPFVIYAVLLLVVGLYIHKPFCRYLCPLGAGFAIFGRFHIMKWLPRRKACGSPCKLCNHRCGIKAIHPDGKINYQECIQCLECEVIYRDDKQCVPLVTANRKRKKVETVELKSDRLIVKSN
ncbi:MAG: ferredoxin [Oceanospirillum sp.]|nr:ferredoxin [Oceanospirillum sp.]